jgi:hypothetical protein
MIFHINNFKNEKFINVIMKSIKLCNEKCSSTLYLLFVKQQYGTHHSYVLVVHTLRVAENKILKIDLPAKRH